MSILGNNSGNMKTPIFHEFKKQASFFFREKIKTARLALTDVTPVQLLAEEATNGNLGGPDARTLKMISRAAFEVDDYWRVVEILHKRLLKFDKGNWRTSYKALIALEHLLTHGPASVADEFQSDRDVIKEMENFQLIDEKGFNWGLNVRKKSERILKLLKKGPLFKEERDKARKISRGIEGFGSFNHKSSSFHENMQESSAKPFGGSLSQFNDYANRENLFLVHDENGMIKTKMEKPLLNTQMDSKDKYRDESKSLFGEHKDEPRVKISMEDCHPFDDTENLTAMSLLSTADELQRKTIV